MNKILYVVLILAVLGGGYWWFTQNQAGKQLAQINTFLANTPTAEQKTYTSAEVATHNTASDCWIVVNGKVINATNFTSLHPGGAEKITRVCGQDITADYNRIGEHMQTIANSVIEKLIVGTVTQ